MKKNRVIEFEPRKRILEKAQKYVESLESFSEEADQGNSRDTILNLDFGLASPRRHKEK